MVTDFEKAIHAYEQERIGRFARVTGYNSEDNRTVVLIASAPDAPQPGLTTVATVGLGQRDNGLTGESGRPLRVELITSGRSEYEFLAGGLANAGLNVATGQYQARPGLVFPNIFSEYDPRVTTPHGLLWYPFPWGDQFDGLELEGVSVEWLLIIPITQSEIQFIADNGPGFTGAGVEKLIDAFEREETDIWDFTRQSAV